MVFVTEMVSYMKDVASLGVELTVEERNLLSVAYKNVIGAKRSAWRIVSSIEQKEESKDAESSKLAFTRQYRIEVSSANILVFHQLKQVLLHLGKNILLSSSCPVSGRL